MKSGFPSSFTFESPIRDFLLRSCHLRVPDDADLNPFLQWLSLLILNDDDLKQPPRSVFLISCPPLTS